MAEKKNLTEKEIGKKIVDLKIELLKSPTKKGRIKKEIARLLTMRKVGPQLDSKHQTGQAHKDSGENTKTKLKEDVK